MKASQIKVGGKYLARISGRIVTVRVDAMYEVPRGAKWRTVYDVTNLNTKRTTRFASAAKFRSEVAPEATV